MFDQPKLSEAEWALVIELLGRESRELPVEIHHCRVASYGEQLRERLDMVHRLLEQLQTTAVA